MCHGQSIKQVSLNQKIISELEHGLHQFESIDELSKFCTWKEKSQYRKITLLTGKSNKKITRHGIPQIKIKTLVK